MGFLKNKIGSALGSDKLNNGFDNKPSIPFLKNHTRNNGTESQSRSLGYQNSQSPGETQFDNEYGDGNGNRNGNGDQVLNTENTTAPQSSPGDYCLRYDAAREPSSCDGFRPLALPQIAYGDGQPFLRGYSDELSQYGILEGAFIDILDTINVAITPNPEIAIFQKGADIAGNFLPGTASIGLMVGQLGVGVGASFGLTSALGKVLAKANLEVFVPKGLEICIGHSKDVDEEVGFTPRLQGDVPSAFEALPENRVASYGDRLAPLTQSLLPVEHFGRNDMFAKVGGGLGKFDNKKKIYKAEKRRARGKFKKTEELEKSFKWLIVRKASSQAIGHWQKTLQKSEEELENEAAKQKA